MKSIAVYCGSSMGSDVAYLSDAVELGKVLAQKKIQLVYGGAKVGLMGALADSCLANTGTVIGVLPTFLKSKELAHDGLNDMHIVESMHERKMKMNELCDAVIALPGGFGTLEELFEMITWAQLGLHQKPVGILNTNGFYDSLFDLLDTMVRSGFLKQLNRDMLLVDDKIEALLDKMNSYRAPRIPKWIKDDEL
jgi:uncharacterized protein (TIGR00730 family)